MTSIAEALIERARALPTDISDGLTSIVARLIGGDAGLPISWLRAATKRIEDGGTGLIRNETMKAVALEVLADPQVVDRALWSIIGEGLRKQVNKEAVAKKIVEAIEVAAGKGTCRAVQQPNADWMNSFIRLAEDATSDGLRDLASRACAVHAGGTFVISHKAIQFLAVTDQKIVDMFNKFRDQVCLDFVLTDEFHDVVLVEALESAGLVSGLGVTRTKDLPTSEPQVVHIIDGSYGLALRGKEHVRLEVFLLTQLGREIHAILPGRDAEAALRKLGKALSKHPLTEIALVKISNDVRSARTKEIIWRAPTSKPSLNVKYEGLVRKLN